MHLVKAASRTKARERGEPPKPKRGAPAKGEPAARERILATAIELFYREGTRAVGVDTIAERSGVSKTSLYRTFASKDDLIAAVIAEQDRLFWRWWDKTVAAHPGEPYAQLVALCAAIVRRMAHPAYRGCPFLIIAAEFPQRDHPGRTLACANRDEMRRRLGELCRAMRASEPDSLAASIALLFNGANAVGPMTGTDDLSSDLLQAVAALVAAHTTASTGKPSKK